MPKASHDPQSARRPSARLDPAASAGVLRNRIGDGYRLAIVLGSGFGGVLTALKGGISVPYAEIPGWLAPTVDGHAGLLVAGRLAGRPVVLLSGRSHVYEGHEAAVMTFPIRVLAELGIDSVLLTNAAGGIRDDLRPGDLMLIEDHINLMGINPLRGPAWPGRERFLDLSRVYDRGLRQELTTAARRSRLRLRRGIYAAVMGPSYETPAEVRALAVLGADAVGMSTVPEAIVAHHCRLRVAALSLVTNRAAGRQPGPISHAEVLAAGRAGSRRASRLLAAFVRTHSRETQG